jgi:hypothetical protein
MYKYQFSKKYQDRLKFYGRTPYVTSESFNEIVSLGFPREYRYWYVVCKCVNFVFYSKKKLNQVYVNGYPVPVKFFTETVVQ